MGWRVAGKTVKITNNILTLCLTPVFMSCLEIKEVFTELCFHMSDYQPAGRISEDQPQSGSTGCGSYRWFCQWLRRKEGDGGFIVDRAWFELIIVTISSVRTRNSLNRKKQDDEDLNLIQDWNRNLQPLTSRYIEEVNYFPSPCKEHSVTHDNHYFNSEWSSWLVFHSWLNHNNCSNQNAPPSPPPAWDSSPM